MDYHPKPCVGLHNHPVPFLTIGARGKFGLVSIGVGANSQNHSRNTGGLFSFSREIWHINTAIRRFLRPAKAAHLCGRAIYLEEHPDKSQPGRIRRHPNEGEFYLTDSRYLNWTNQSVLTTRRSFLDTIMAHVRSHPSRRTSNGFQSPERPLNSSWWRQQRFRIGVGRGLFTHRRLDGSWRPKHHAYQAESNSA